MKKLICIFAIVAVSSVLFFSCEELPCYNLDLVGTWTAPGGSTTYTFTETNSFEKVTKSTSGVVVTTTPYPGTWETSGTNTLNFDFKDPSKSNESRLYEFVAGIDALTDLAANSTDYTRTLGWAEDANYTADDKILLFADPDDFSTSGWGDIFRLR
ncbi:MAG: hypothetical protein JEZ04_03570 [Spirochaetales bacterium]|nr:hypothetical protein [Spirochaetales bacterium]